MSMDVVFVGHRCCDHSPSGGYDQVCALFPDAGWLHGPALEAGRIEWQRRPQAGDTTMPRVFHVFYGDCSGKALPAILRQRFAGASIISSAHRPISQLRIDQPARLALEASDAIITVSDTQARDFADLGLPGPVYPIPHGVWTKTFRPTTSSQLQRTEVLLVGSFLRDWKGAREVVASLAQQGIRSVALGAGAREHLLVENGLVDVLPRVSEEELAGWYDRAAAVFLPFVDATASNALLEAMAAGCPVVCPRLPSLVKDYLGDDSDAYEPGRYDVATARLVRYVRNPSDRDAKSKALMMRADRFDWARLVPRYAAVYEKVAADSRIACGLS
jgi:glycosyltransferase involved in cell wall biosynthesis